MGPMDAGGYPISISTDKLDFGNVPFHGAVVRHLVLRYDGEEAVRAWFFASGGGYSVQPRELMLEPGIESRIAVTVMATNSTLRDIAQRVAARAPLSSPLLATRATRRRPTRTDSQ